MCKNIFYYPFKIEDLCLFFEIFGKLLIATLNESNFSPFPINCDVNINKL